MKPFVKLYIPTVLETLFIMMAGMVDMVMLSTVGTANTYIGISVNMFHIECEVRISIRPGM